MIADDLDEPLDVLRGELAVFSKDQSPLFVKGENITAVVGHLPGIHQRFLVIAHINGPGIAFLLVFKRGRNGKFGSQEADMLMIPTD